MQVGIAELAATLTRSFLSDLWEYRPFRGRWALRWRTKDHVRGVAAALGNDAASYAPRTLIPAEALSVTLQYALLDDLAESQRSHRAFSADGTLRLAGPDDTADEMPPHYGIMPKIAEMLGWLARHRPATAGRVITSVTGEAERQLGIPHHVTEQSIRVALDLDGDTGDTLDGFLTRSWPPPPTRRVTDPQGTIAHDHRDAGPARRRRGWRRHSRGRPYRTDPPGETASC